MRYSVKTRHRIFVKSYEFLYFAKDFGKNLSDKYSQKVHDSTTCIEVS